MSSRQPASALEYAYTNSQPAHTEAYLWPVVLRILKSASPPTRDRRIFDLGCGNGAFSARLQELGYSPVGVDPSEAGVAIAKRSHPGLNVNVGSAYDDLHGKYGQFPAVVSLEVVEHVYAPRDYARTVFELLQPGGLAIISTPFHGYWKNLALALSGKMDAHFTVLWDHGHIKFWSVKTLTALLEEAGFRRVDFHWAGRNILMPKSMVAVAWKP